MLACSSAAEQTAVNRPVVGSIPTVPAKRLWAGSLRGKTTWVYTFDVIGIEANSVH